MHARLAGNSLGRRVEHAATLLSLQLTYCKAQVVTEDTYESPWSSLETEVQRQIDDTSDQNI